MCRVVRGEWWLQSWALNHSLVLWCVLLMRELILGSQARLKSHFVCTGPEDGSNTKLHLKVQEVVPCVLEEQVLEKKHAFSSGLFKNSHILNIVLWHSKKILCLWSSHKKQVHCIESAEFLCYDCMACRAGIQQGGDESGYMQTRVPQWLLQNTQSSQHRTSLNIIKTYRHA